MTFAVLDVGMNTDDSTWPSGLAGLSAEALPGSNDAAPIMPPMIIPTTIFLLFWMMPWM